MIKIKLFGKSCNPLLPKLEGLQRITNGQTITVYTNSQITKSSFEKMLKDGKKVIYTRGYILENYPNKTEEEILQIQVISLNKTIEDINKMKQEKKLPSINDLKELKYEIIR